MTGIPLCSKHQKLLRIVSVKNEKSELSAGEKVHTSVMLKADKPVKGTLTARLYDNYERLVDENIGSIFFRRKRIQYCL